MHPLVNSVSLLHVLCGVTIVKVPKAFKQITTSGLELATAEFREKHLNLLSHGGVLVSKIREHFIRNSIRYKISFIY